MRFLIYSVLIALPVHTNAMDCPEPQVDGSEISTEELDEELTNAAKDLALHGLTKPLNFALPPIKHFFNLPYRAAEIAIKNIECFLRTDGTFEK